MEDWQPVWVEKLRFPVRAPEWCANWVCIRTAVGGITDEVHEMTYSSFEDSSISSYR